MENVNRTFKKEKSNIPRDNGWDSSRINERHESSVKVPWALKIINF